MQSNFQRFWHRITMRKTSNSTFSEHPAIQKYLRTNFPELCQEGKKPQISRNSLVGPCEAVLEKMQQRQRLGNYQDRVAWDMQSKPFITDLIWQVIVFAVLLEDRRIYQELIRSLTAIELDHYYAQIDAGVSMADLGPKPSYERFAGVIPSNLRELLESLPGSLSQKILEYLTTISSDQIQMLEEDADARNFRLEGRSSLTQNGMTKHPTKGQRIVRKGLWPLDNSNATTGAQGKVFVIAQDFDWWFEISRLKGELQPDQRPKLNADGEAFYVFFDQEGKWGETPPFFLKSPGFMSLNDAINWASTQLTAPIYWEREKKPTNHLSPIHRGHVFVSYMHDDQAVVSRIVRSLENNNIRVWMDRNSISAGTLWPDAISQAISGGAIFLACFSKAFNERADTYMNEELKLAADLLATCSDTSWFVPLFLQPCKLPSIRIGPREKMSDVQGIDFINFETGIDLLLRHIGGSGIVLGDGPIEQRLTTATDIWRNSGRLDDYLLQGDALLVARCWSIHMERNAPGKINNNVLEYIQASYDATGDDGWVYILHRKRQCISCGETYRVENIGMCTDCFNFYCFNCHDKHIHCPGIIVG